MAFIFSIIENDKDVVCSHRFHGVNDKLPKSLRVFNNIMG